MISQAAGIAGRLLVFVSGLIRDEYHQAIIRYNSSESEFEIHWSYIKKYISR